MPKKKTIKKPVKKKKPIKKQGSKRAAVKRKTAKRPTKKKSTKKKAIVRKKQVKRIKKAKKSVKPVKKSIKKSIKKPIKKKPVRKPARKKAVRKVKPKKKITRKPKTKPKKTRTRKKSTVRVIRRSTRGTSLDQLFESSVKVQIMKLFFRNPTEGLLLKEAVKRLRIDLMRIRPEMKRLEKIGLLRTKQISPRKQLFFVNPNFDFFGELRGLILKSSPVSKENMLKKIRRLGRIKVVLLSGIFIGNNTSKADLLIVGDNINQKKLNTLIRKLESEAGTGINCVAISTKEFNYRYDMYDRFIRDLLDERNEFLINKLYVNN